MKRMTSLGMTVLFALTMVLACPALAEEAAAVVDVPIQVISSVLERCSLGLIPLEGPMTFLYNNTTDSSGRLGEAPENLMIYTLAYTMEQPGERLVRMVLTGPDGAAERENTLPLGNVEGENSFMAIMLAASGAAGEYTAELYIDGILSDTAYFSDEVEP